MDASFPELPSGNWPVSITMAHERLAKGYSDMCVALAQEDTDPARMRLLRQRVDAVYIPIIQALEKEPQLDPLWVSSVAEMFVGLIPELDQACVASQEREDRHVSHISTVYTVHSGRRGRPKTAVSDVVMLDWFAPGRQLSARNLARTLGIDRRTVKKEMDRLGIERDFHDLTDDELDELFKAVKRERPEEGIGYFTSVLRNARIRIQQHRIAACVQRCTPLQRAVSNPVAQPRVYEVARPNKVWHCDGHHKLIRWGFVIHGFVDGHSRMITSMVVNTNNRAETVLEGFLAAVAAYGSPSRLRGDRGGENIRVAVWMIINKGINRGSFLWGSSTRNTRIERLWREVGEKFARRWRAFFTRLERMHLLDAENEHHLWLLHTLFLDDLRTDCDTFINLWNLHPLRDRGSRRRQQSQNTGNKSPSDMFLRGQLQQGIYVDELEGVDPALLRRYYAVDRPYTYQDVDATGAGHSDREESESDLDGEEDAEALADDDYDLDELEQCIAADQVDNLRHDAIEAPKTTCPFDAEQLAEFNMRLGQIQAQAFVPPFFGLLDTELPGGVYPLVESITIARKLQEIELDLHIWYPRAVRWAQGLLLMTDMMSPD